MYFLKKSVLDSVKFVKSIFLIFCKERAMCLSETNKLAVTPTFHSDFQV